MVDPRHRTHIHVRHPWRAGPAFRIGPRHGHGHHHSLRADPARSRAHMQLAALMRELPPDLPLREAKHEGSDGDVA